MTPTLLPGPLRYDSKVNVVFDGNSLVSGVGAPGSPFPTQAAAMAPIVGSGATWSNIGISGQTWAQMNGQDAGSAADVDAAWKANCRNVLVCWETTNSIYNVGRTGVQAAADAESYVRARLAQHPWLIVLLTTLPRQVSGDETTQLAKNAQLDIADSIMRANYRAWGAADIVEVRQAGSPFILPDYTNASFAASSAGLWFEAAGGRIHLTPTGYNIVAGYTAPVLKRLRKRALL